MATYEKFIYIRGYRFRDVTNQTVAGRTYSYREAEYLVDFWRRKRSDVPDCSD